MLVWIAALRCEVKPIIDYYHLKKSNQHRAFDLYINADYCCVVSGIGQTASAAATAWVAALNKSEQAIAWINIGIAGTAQDSVGSIFWMDKIMSLNTEPCSPVPINNNSIESRSCFTLDNPSTDYKPDLLFDMEASAFFTTATQFSAIELVHCLKVISDNQNQPPQRNKAKISQLIQQNMAKIDAFANDLQHLKINQ
ncbi:MAG: hypothetical protein GY763_02425 [Gammaproteobacteria bacterium]|nr:hypothetical protein [Gammaproteobacteria bacterium]